LAARIPSRSYENLDRIGLEEAITSLFQPITAKMKQPKEDEEEK